MDADFSLCAVHPNRCARAPDMTEVKVPESKADQTAHAVPAKKLDEISSTRLDVATLRTLLQSSESHLRQHSELPGLILQHLPPHRAQTHEFVSLALQTLAKIGPLAVDAVPFCARLLSSEFASLHPSAAHSLMQIGPPGWLRLIQLALSAGQSPSVLLLSARHLAANLAVQRAVLPELLLECEH